MNDDGWHTLLVAGVDRNVLVYDADAADGQFTKRLISLMKTVMRRNAGGNTGSLKRGTYRIAAKISTMWSWPSP